MQTSQSFSYYQLMGKANPLEQHAMKFKSEIERINSAYEKRKDNISSARYSLFNNDNFYYVQSRDKAILEMLKSSNIVSLNDKRILDIGCGTGNELINLIRYGADPGNLYGIDLLKSRIETARGLSPNISFTCSDASEIPYRDGFFDIVIQFTVFTSIFNEDMKKSIAEEMLRVIKPDGIIVWYDFHVHNPNNPDVRGVKKKEIYKLFSGCQIKLKRITLAPPIARIIAPHSMILCHLLEKLNLLNTHYLGCIRKLR